MLSFSLIMLNTDLHSPQIAPERKMKLEQFVSNNRGVGRGGGDLPRALLERLYTSIARSEIQIEQREYIRGVAIEGWLHKQDPRGVGPFQGAPRLIS